MSRHVVIVDTEWGVPEAPVRKRRRLGRWGRWLRIRRCWNCNAVLSAGESRCGRCGVAQ